MSEPDHRADMLDVIALGLAYSIGAVAAVSLAAAYLGIHSLATVAIGGGAVLLATALSVRRAGWRQAVQPGFARRAWLVLPALLLAGVLFFPGFRFATGDKDPGIYVMHALSIEKTGDIRVPRTPLQQAGVFTVDDVPGVQWRGFEPVTDPATVTPSFFHLWPALLADAFALVGFRALDVAVPLLGLVSVLLMFCLTRRLTNTWAATAAAVVLATNMMEVWQARYPTVEMLGQVLFLGSALGVVLAAQTGWRWAAFAGGVLNTAGFLNRGEVVILVALGLLAAGAAWAVDLKRPVAGWFAAGSLVLMPLAWIQAYHVAEIYAFGSEVPGKSKLAAVVALSLGLAAVGQFSTWPHRLWLRAASAVGGGPWLSRLRVALSAVIVSLFVLAGLRPLFGVSYINRNGERIRSWDERSLHRLALFFYWPAILLAVAGLLWCVWTRWSLVRNAVITVSVGMLSLFLFRARNSPQMMWWNRRFIPVAIPGLVLLMAFALAGAMAAVRWRRQVLALVVLVLAGTVLLQGRQSWALHGHDEHGGSYGIATSIAALSGPTPGVFLWEPSPCCSAEALLYGSPVWMLGDGDDSAKLPKDRAEWPAYVDSILAAAGDHPVFLVLQGNGDPLGDFPHIISEVQHLEGILPVWAESNILRPSGQNNFPYDIIVYRVEP